VEREHPGVVDHAWIHHAVAAAGRERVRELVDIDLAALGGIQRDGETWAALGQYLEGAACDVAARRAPEGRR
jgi:hypothetical protein